jgi:hypothetical protein
MTFRQGSVKVQHWETTVITFTQLSLVLSLTVCTSHALAAEIVRVDARCSDSSVQYSIQKAAVDAIQADSKYKLAAGLPHVVAVRLIAVPIKTESQSVPTAVVIALSAVRKTANGWETVAFSNTLVQNENVGKFVRDSVLEALGDQ